MDNLRVEKRYTYGTPTSSIGFCNCHMQKGTLPWRRNRHSEWYFAKPALQGGWASRLHTDEEPRASPIISFFFSPLSGWINEVHSRRISHSLAKENYCAVFPAGGWCGLTLGPKICLMGNIATHTPHQGVCYGGWPKQGHALVSFINAFCPGSSECDWRVCLMETDCTGRCCVHRRIGQLTGGGQNKVGATPH